MSLFKSDLKAESILSLYLDECYKKAGKHFERIDSIDLQHKGIDLIFYNDKIPFKVDEKAQLHYLNINLPTFALEIDYLKGEELKKGWLFDTSKSTEYYSFVFSIHLKDDKAKLENVSEIESAEIIIVNRLKLILELQKLGLTYSFCKDISRELRNNESVSRKDHDSGFNFQLTKHLSEEPVNLVVRKSFLESIGNKLN